MKISEAIAALSKILVEKGDLTICTEDKRAGEYSEIDRIEYIASDTYVDEGMGDHAGPFVEMRYY